MPSGHTVLEFVDLVIYSHSVFPVPHVAIFEEAVMKYTKTLLTLLIVAIASACAFAQGKGVDTQTKKVSDAGTSSSAGTNGTKQDTGTTGSGINFGKDKTRTTTLLPNPYRLIIDIHGKNDKIAHAKLTKEEAATLADVLNQNHA